ncbi:MAG: UDP-D-galactose:(glucosyl)lipopolysaccharide-1,6-D-galactosyltransferase [Methanobacterium sp. PtaU1.Bin097]|jgi:glycosyltransferase involved in cell wall biosynthesis|nr:MAG: UDP-D-galactose:(glucosyl)lipopolysaccharide-1,6-D-galactosyltransferase [Methanobacterium sp. PtaU1.Bin097]
MKTKILILVESLKVGGGSERFAATLGSKLYKEGYDISYLTLMEESPKYEFKGDYYTLNESYIYGNIFKRTLDLFRYSPKITKLCKELSIETIISVSEVANFHAVLSRWLYGNKVRIITSQHINPEIFMESKIKSSLIKFFYPRADKTVCVSREVERILNEEYNVQNTQTIYNMMDIEENIKLSREKLPDKYQGLFNENNAKFFNFISLGRLARQKGQWFLIRSFRRVVDQHPHAKLFILGEGVLRKELEELINKLELTKNVFLLGEQSNIFPFLLNSQCFVLTSLWEGLPMALIEALSLNLPIISTDCKTGPREILCPELDLNKAIDYPYLGNHAILSEPFPNELIFNSINEVPLHKPEKILANLMTEIIENPRLTKNYSKGQVIAKNFDKEKIIGQWKKLLTYE